ncbi:MAG: ATP-binding protein [Cytophagales bacterium]|nr:ATP-binding protein [Cytophagales bacterium]
MDVERILDTIEIESDVDHNFDDITIISGEEKLNCQIKDIDPISFKDVIIQDNEIIIKKTKHKLSEGTNILFFKNIEIAPNNSVLGIPSYSKGNLHFVSINRQSIEERIKTLYPNNYSRFFDIRSFFHEKLDLRRLKINKEELPTINVFLTELVEESIATGLQILEFDRILLIEGKPGVGKSHLVNEIKERFSKNVLYRFWVSNQDKYYRDRLLFANFLFDLSKKLFGDLVVRDEKKIIDEIESKQYLLLIDGLDHVENYNPQDLELFIKFISKAKVQCRVIVLSRPLAKKLPWKKQLLKNWNKTQTNKVLEKLYHIESYRVTSDIYKITDGYPILVRYVAESYKLNGAVPKLSKLASVNDYYSELVNNQKSKRSLGLFLCSSSFYMKSEIALFLEKEASSYVNEFIEEHPYLFEIKLNRISLFHDSFNTFLLSEGIDISQLENQVKDLVVASVLRLEKKFLSRFDSFKIDKTSIKEVVTLYSRVDIFNKLIQEVVDFEVIPDFYESLRELLIEISPYDLEPNNYFDLSIILNLVSRYTWVFDIDEFLYTYTKAVLFNGYSEEQITSSGYLFGMVYFVKTRDLSLLKRVSSEDMRDLESFEDRFFDSIDEEEFFFENHREALTKEQVDKILNDKLNFHPDNIVYLLENVYSHKVLGRQFSSLYRSISKFMDGETSEAVETFESLLKSYGFSHWSAHHYLMSAQRNILAKGKRKEDNIFLSLSFPELILSARELDSFDSWREILAFIRLSVYDKRKIEIQRIVLFLNKYYSRKDYCLISIYAALNVFESLGLFEMVHSVKLITRIQERSEKGYKGLLLDFIEQYAPKKIIPFLEENFDIHQLHVNWFLLSPIYINEFSKDIFFAGTEYSLRPYSSHNSIRIEEIINVLNSSWSETIVRVLVMRNFSVRVADSDIANIELLKTLGVPYEVNKEDKSYKTSELENFNNGILNKRNSNYIQKNNLAPEEVASYSDGYHSALGELSLFQSFKSEQISEKIQVILYEAMTGKIRSINAFYDLYHYVGHSIKLINDHCEEYDSDALFKSFEYYLKVLMISESN